MANDRSSSSRRTFIQSIGAALTAPVAATLLDRPAFAQDPAVPEAGRRGRGAPDVPAGPQLPLHTTGLEHLGVNTPDSVRSLSSTRRFSI